MTKYLIPLVFFTGLVPVVQTAINKYHLILEGKNWSDAQAYCRTQYTDLAIIRNQNQMDLLQNEKQTQLFSSMAWVGLNVDTTGWRWSMGNEPLGSMRPWAKNQPNNQAGNQECTVTSPNGWVDLYCNRAFHFLCFDDRYTGDRRYIYVATNMSWSKAQVYCRQYHTDLASSRDETEDSVLKAFTSGYTWFGLFRDSWRWADQTSFSQFSFLGKQMNNALGNENCGYLNDTLAADAPCSTIMPFFCYGALKQRIVQLKLRSDGDVNDPAEKAAILDKLDGKLRAMGLGRGVTVKWRKRSDGEVFHKVERVNPPRR